MPRRCYKISFLRKSASLSRDDTRKFVTDVMKSFGGLALLSMATVAVRQDGTVEINGLDAHALDLAHSAMALCGSYQEMKCCIREAV